MPLRFVVLMTVAIALSACSDQASLSHAMLSHTKIDGALGRNSFALSQPSQRTLAVAANKPKDRHSMPVYNYGERKRLVRTTAYTCSERDHRPYGRKNACGTRLLYGQRVRSAAADWSFYPVGTTFRIKGLPQLYVVDDYGSALAGTGTIDLYKPNMSGMQQWGRRNVEIQIVQWGSFERSASILSQRTHYRHCRQMFDNILRLQPRLRKSFRG